MKNPETQRKVWSGGKLRKKDMNKQTNLKSSIFNQTGLRDCWIRKAGYSDWNVMIIAMSWMGCQAEIFTLTFFLHNEETSAQLEKLVTFDTETLIFITQESIKKSLKSWISLKCSTRKDSLKSLLHTSQLEATIFFTIIHSKWNAEKNTGLGREMSDNLEGSVVFLIIFFLICCERSSRVTLLYLTHAHSHILPTVM